MKNILVGYMIVLFLLVGCAENDQQESSSSERENNEKQTLPEAVEVITEDLNVPWSIEKLEDTFYITERPGNIVKVEDGIIERQHVELKKDLATASEAGLLGFVLAPDFLESNEAFAYYTYEDSSGQFNRIITLCLEDNSWKEEQVLLDHIPSGYYHHGGRLAFGPDEKLYATTGDASKQNIAQDLDSLGGKILRMNLDGSIPSDNPLPDSYVYSYGHRNPQGLTWTPDGTLYASEHGDNANDEVNLIESGQNYGWPIIKGDEEQKDLISPLFTSGDEKTWAPSGMEYENEKLYVAALRGSAVLEFDLKTNEHQEFVNGFGRIRDVFIEDEFLYFISNNLDGRGNPQEKDDKLYRILLSE